MIPAESSPPDATGGTSFADPLLVADRVTKAYGRFVALRDFSLTAHAGEVVALLGANGAGKSTFIKIISGVETMTSGTIRIGDHGAETKIAGPASAARLGIGVVHQELALLGNLTAAENVALGLTQQGLLSGTARRSIRARYEELARLLPGAPAADTRLETLSLFHWQLVAIIRAIAFDARVLVLDEPTSSLNTTERVALHTLIRSLAEQGMTVVYVTHFLDDALDVADRVLVLRDGSTVYEAPAAHTTVETLLEHMTGDASAATAGRTAPRAVANAEAPPRLGVEGLKAAGIGPVSFHVQPGECLGLYGLEGCGATNLVQALYGLIPSSGRMIVNDSPVSRGTRNRILRGIGLATSDRRHSLIADWSVADNVALPTYAKKSLLATPQVSRAGDAARTSIRDFGIKASPGQRVRALSGGNQQKMLLARWAPLAEQVLLLDEPTRGVDVRGRSVLHDHIRELVDDGRSVIAFSTDPEEIVSLADRVLILAQGQIIDQLVGDQITVDRLESSTRVWSHPTSDLNTLENHA